MAIGFVAFQCGVILEESEAGASQDEGIGKDLHSMLLDQVKGQIKEKYSNEEFALMQAINAYLDMSKGYNLVFERLSEWFGLYVPEIKITNPSSLVELVKMLADHDMSEDRLGKALGDEESAREAFEKVKNSSGRELGSEEAKAISSFSEYLRLTQDTLDRLSEYIKATATSIMPNSVYLTDDKIMAEMLSRAGSMEKMATMPASTIQLLGAEKALFKHIKFGSKPPKYGILFKLPAVSAAPRDTRGRIARIYATKLAIALKADFYSKRFIADKLKEDLEKAVEKVKNSPPREKKPERQQFTRRSIGNRGAGWGGRKKEHQGNRNAQWGGNKGDRRNRGRHENTGKHPNRV